MQNIAIIGAGQMGSGITQYLAMNAINVTLIDYKESNIERASSNIENGLTKLVLKGKISEERKLQVLSCIQCSTSLEICREVDLVIEAIPEILEKKESLFRKLSEIMTETSILATNTSSLSITKLGSMFIDPSRVIGLHFFNPAFIMPLVEVIRGLETSGDTLEKITAFIIAINKEAVFVKDQSGFIVNRILISMINEAIFVLQEGIATPEEIDKAMKLGSNQPMGPLELADFIGLDTCLSIMETLHSNLGEDKYRPATLLRKYVEGNRLGRKTKKGFYTY
ncbi:3-hydroxyacyl-CoA dehydrogenase NAD-binding domain-containing protein [Psychrobacillus psychrodurans]|uniref:3-hydroxyacyl-CoA dehydrogenase family protein n=1 Tax=Psychrobacillus psychrodurans TaxID=126157 RepID=UPI001F4E2850|nr:3-hydroxyacyl-CoA dehydrogenase NAD-binding domain-containing protein [Psychrobacillus psychrodurans]MCK1995790.1 3-hydroxyacyl-CoA dehydrogenase NAD-binding domain-containing protein [Psychrobacillus psychrodurans]